MGIETALFSYLSTKPSITALVGTRVYATIAPSSVTYPFITYFVVSETHEHDMTGASGLTNAVIQIDAWAKLVAERQAIGEAVRNALDGFKAPMGTELLDIRNCFLQNRNTFEVDDDLGTNLPIHRASLDFSIWHVESLPTL
jgi:hypothetical protein